MAPAVRTSVRVERQRAALLLGITMLLALPATSTLWSSAAAPPRSASISGLELGGSSMRLTTNPCSPAPCLAATFAVGSDPTGVAYDPTRSEVLISNSNSNSVDVVSDVSDSVVASVPVGAYPDALVVDRGVGEVYVANYDSESVSVISDATDAVVATIGVGSNPAGLAYDNGRGEIFVSNSGSDNVSVISDSTHSVVASIAVGSGPEGVAYDPATGRVFVANCGKWPAWPTDNNLSVISDTTNSVVATIPVGVAPLELSDDTGTSELFITHEFSNRVSMLSTTNGSLVGSVRVGSSPLFETYDPTNAEVFVGDYNGSVDVISDASDSVVANLSTPSPQGLAYDSGTNEVYVANYGYRGQVTVIWAGPQPPPIPQRAYGLSSAAYLIMALGLTVAVVVVVVAFVRVRGRKSRRGSLLVSPPSAPTHPPST